jgi:hypothetical protein
MVAKHVTTLSTPSVCSLTVVRGVKGDTIYQETQMTVMVLLDNGKDGTIRGLDAIVCPSTVKSTGKTVLAVFADERPSNRIILLATLNSYLIKIIGG